MKYLKEFETQAAYNAAESSLILPNVSLITENNKVEYNSLTPPAPSHDYVEIGGVKWATMNVGANSITDTGLYFQWGDTQGYTASQVGSGSGQKAFDWADYKYGGNDIGGQTKYNSSDGKVVLEASDDAVTAAWGGNWRMPTKDELTYLEYYVTTAWTSDYQNSGVAGLICTDTEDESKVLFFPAVGYCSNGSVNNVGEEAYCWHNALNENSNTDAWSLCGYDGGTSFDNTNSRYYGLPVRGVFVG